MDNATLIEAYKRELAGAERSGKRDIIAAIQAELAALGVAAEVETTGAPSAAKRTRKKATAADV